LAPQWRERKAARWRRKDEFMQKCKRDTCEVKAVGGNGRKLSGAAKKSAFMKKCEAGA
jgi:hypothetical protein